MMLQMDLLKDGQKLANKRQILSGEFDMTNEEMVSNIRRICSGNSASYYNIRNCRHQSNVMCGIVYNAILNRELELVQEEIDKLLEKKKAIINLLESE